MKEKRKAVHGGNEDGIGISPGVNTPSAQKNDGGPTSAAGKILPKPEKSPAR